ncbi:MAG: HAD family phosphatase [Candidatus Dadabacteria bacterium]|nr:HAD family phosphatase [Candidatus Dadabacteria bacterium]MYA48252.1 HAD family phosphatase [Candidatus Dadabacteria bacterium]MYG82249.1 HAD family phosphatase [Candidatus Dadabacteria bacterium]
MDGVIIDSEPLWEKSESIMLKQKGFAGNESYRKEYRKKIMGLSQRDSVKLLKETFGLDESPEEILNARLKILLELYEKELRLSDGVPELLKILSAEKHIKTALASGSPMKVIEFVLKKFSLSDTFGIKVSGDCVERGKPHPDIYLETARRLGVSTGECVAIEDSINGIVSAKDAGMRCIAVPDPRIATEDYPKADIFRKSVSEVSIEDIKSFS